MFLDFILQPKNLIVDVFLVSFSLFGLYFLFQEIDFWESFETEILLQIQSYHTPFLNLIFRIFSMFGFELFFIVVPMITWFGSQSSRNLGFHLTLLILESYCFLSIFKSFFARARPFSLHDIELTGGDLYSFPSGHSWASVVCWLFIAYHSSLLWVNVFAVIAITCAVSSRIYFHVHYIHDVIFGVFFGILFLRLYLRLERFSQITPGGLVKLKLATGHWFLLLLIFLSFGFVDRHILQVQPGLRFGPWMTLGTNISFILDQKYYWESDRKIRSLFLRALLGFPPVGLFYFIGRFCVRASMTVENQEFLLFSIIGGLSSFLSVLWILYLSAYVFSTLGLLSKTLVELTPSSDSSIPKKID